jgi:hypothetical protein
MSYNRATRSLVRVKLNSYLKLKSYGVGADTSLKRRDFYKLFVLQPPMQNANKISQTVLESPDDLGVKKFFDRFEIRKTYCVSKRGKKCFLLPPPAHTPRVD